MARYHLVITLGIEKKKKNEKDDFFLMRNVNK